MDCHFGFFHLDYRNKVSENDDDIIMQMMAMMITMIIAIMTIMMILIILIVNNDILNTLLFTEISFINKAVCHVSFKDNMHSQPKWTYHKGNRLLLRYWTWIFRICTSGINHPASIWATKSDKMDLMSKTTVCLTITTLENVDFKITDQWAIWRS